MVYAESDVSNFSPPTKPKKIAQQRRKSVPQSPVGRRRRSSIAPKVTAARTKATTTVPTQPKLCLWCRSYARRNPIGSRQLTPISGPLILLGLFGVEKTYNDPTDRKQLGGSLDTMGRRQPRTFAVPEGRIPLLAAVLGSLI